MLHRIAPRAQLLVMLRDPIERCRSGLAHALDRLGGVTPDVIADAIWRGRYATQLAPVLEIVPHEQLLVLQLEQCRSDPVAWARRTFEFLGLDPVEVAPRADKSNAASCDFTMTPEFTETLREQYADELTRLESLVPGVIDFSLWRSA